MEDSGRLCHLLTWGLTALTYLGLNLSLGPMGSSALDEDFRAAAGEDPPHSSESLWVTAAQRHILHVQASQSEKRKAMNKASWHEVVKGFHKVAQGADWRAVVASGAGRMSLQVSTSRTCLQTSFGLEEEVWPL